jgi:hypothetical protein
MRFAQGGHSARRREHIVWEGHEMIHPTNRQGKPYGYTLCSRQMTIGPHEPDTQPCAKCQEIRARWVAHATDVLHHYGASD